MVLYEAIEEQKQKINELIAQQEEFGRALRQTANSTGLETKFEDVLVQTYSIEKNLIKVQEQVTNMETKFYTLQATMEDDFSNIKTRLEILDQVLREALGARGLPIQVGREE